MENKEQINLINFEKCRYIKLEDVGKFLQSQGYNWTGYINDEVQDSYLAEFDPDHEFYFHQPSTEQLKAYNRFLIWINPLFYEKAHVNCNNNKFVRYIYFEISTFKVYTVVQDKEYSTSLTKNLEKDLSKEWVQFLAKQKEDYKDSLIALCIKRTAKAKEELENAKKHVEIEKIKLDKYLEDKTASTINKLYSLDETARWICDLD